MQKKQKIMMVFLFPTLLFHVWRIPENFLRSSRCKRKASGCAGTERKALKIFFPRRWLRGGPFNSGIAAIAFAAIAFAFAFRV